MRRKPLLTFLVLLLVTFLSKAGLGQSQFAGTWQTAKANKLTGKHAITVIISVTQSKITGSVVLVNPDASEIEEPILTAVPGEKSLEFETKLGSDTFSWSLTPKSKTKAFLHGSVREMLIDERMVRIK
jgi:hypothetical protein